MQNQSNLFFLDKFTTKVCEELFNKASDLFQEISFYELASHFQSPPEKEEGHWALPCFFLSKKLKINPQEISQKITESCSNSLVFEKAIQKGPYVNFCFKKNFLKNTLLTSLKDGLYFLLPKKEMSQILMEYSQPNTHKELHIGHMRNICFGFSLVSLLKKRAFPCITCTYPGDVGTHVAKCLWYLKFHNKEKIPHHKKGEWLGTIYTKALKKFEQEQKDPIKKKQNNETLTNILQQIQNQKGEFYILWKETRMWSKKLMDKVYEWIGVLFDKWYWESEVDKPSVEWVKSLYQEGRLQMSESAIGMHLGEPLGFSLLLKSDGNGLYATKDLYLFRKKFKDYNPSKNIYIVDQRQDSHFQQVFKVLEKLGWKEEIKKSLHLKYNFVELKTGPMSSRAGNIVPIMELVEKMKNYIISTFLDKYKNEWSEEKINQTADSIVKGAIQYGMNEQDLNKKIVFDMKDWLKFDGRSGVYIQYAYARACSLLNKNLKSYSLKNNKKFNEDIEMEYLRTPEEWQLIIHLSWFSLVMEKSAWQMKTSTVCYYLFYLAQKFSKFYQNCPIGSLKDEKQKQFRLYLVHVVKVVLKEGLDVLSIPAPEQM